MTKKENDDFPSVGEIYETWLTAAQVAKMHDMDTSNVRYLCLKKRLRAFKLGKEWRIDPVSARAYKRKMPPRNP